MPKNLSASGGLCPPDQGLCPWTTLGAEPPDPLIGSRSALTMCPPTFKLLLPPLELSMVIGTVQRTAPIRNSLLQFAELHLSTVVNFSSVNWTNEFVIGSVRCTKPSGTVLLWDPSSKIWRAPWSITSLGLLSAHLDWFSFFEGLTLVTYRLETDHSTCVEVACIWCYHCYALWCGLIVVIETCTSLLPSAVTFKFVTS